MKFCVQPLLFILILFTSAFPQDPSKYLTTSEIFSSKKFEGESIRKIHWAKNGDSFFYNEVDKVTGLTNIMKYDVATAARERIVAGNEVVPAIGGEPIRFHHNIWSPEDRYILLADTLRARSIKTTGDFYHYDIKTKRIRRLTKTDKKLVDVKFSPDGEYIAFVKENNLVKMYLDSGKETQLTYDGEEHVLNGHFDWVYEEEFGIIDGWRWSPDGKYIAYWQIDERRVPEFEISQYDSLHLNWIDMRYPKAGDPNSIVKIGVVNVKTGKNVWMDTGSDDDIYIPRIKWLPSGNQLAILRMNRLQNKVELLIGDVTNGETKVIFTDTDDKWIRIDVRDLIFLKKTDQFVWTSEKSGYQHIFLYDMNGKFVRQVTNGKWEVREVVTVDEANGVIYFMAAKESPLENHLYRVDFNGKNLKRITKSPGWHSVKFSPTKKMYVDTFSQINVPEKVGLFTDAGELKDMILENPINELKEYETSKFEFFDFKTSDGVKLNAWMLKPPDFKNDKDYPVLMYVYGGPGSQTVVNRWDRRGRMLWFQLFAQKGYIVASIDNRGTGARGSAFKKMTYKNLGHWEVNDQIEGAKYLASLPFVDKNRLGIFGWSYGGYMSSLCIFKGNDVFKTAIAVAPVSHWKFYDTIYTERYMQTPQLNPEGYENSSPLKYAKDLKGNFLLIHGTSDDNVHFQNSVVLANELIAHNKQFEMMIYPGRYHGIREVTPNSQEHIYTLMTNFLLEKL